MCLGQPGRVLRREGAMVEVAAGGEVRWYSALARPEIRTGDLVLTHADRVLTILTEDEAAEIADAIAELEAAAQPRRRLAPAGRPMT